MVVDDAKLVENIQNQLKRLMQQLVEIEQQKNKLDEDEFTDMKNDTLEQLKELEKTLDRVKCGDVTVTDQLTATKMAIRNAISEAFKTPEIVALFAKKDRAALRQKMMLLDSDYHLRKLSAEAYKARKLEFLNALHKLNDELSAEEKNLVDSASKIPTAQFELASSQVSCNESVISARL